MKKEKYIDSDGTELVKTTWDGGDIEYRNREGKKHRLDGPAIVWSSGYQAWFKDGTRHREDGPAIISADGIELYYLEGKRVSKREVDLYWIKKQVQQ